MDHSLKAEILSDSQKYIMCHNLIYGAELQQSPVYFKVIKAAKSDSLNIEREIMESLNDQDAMFGSSVTSSLCVLMSWREEDTRASYSQRQVALSEQIQQILMDSTQKGQVVALHAHGEGYRFQRGFLLMGYDELWCSSWMESVIVSLNAQTQSLSYIIIEPARCKVRVRCEVVTEGSRSQGRVVVCPRPSCHPVFMHPHNSSVYHSLQEALDVLNSCTHIPGVQELLDVADPYLKEGSVCTTSDLEHPFIVIEGLDGTGKSTLTDTLAMMLAAEQLHTPPAVLRELRETFNNLPPLLRRAYFTVGNYMVTHQVAMMCRTAPVLSDRFWHSTAAYAIATDCASGDESVLPPSDHSVYQWPRDLLRPYVVLLVNVNENKRQSRMAGRLANTEKNISKFETRISNDKLYMRRIMAAYHNMRKPEVIPIDGNGTKEEVVDAALRVLKEYNIVPASQTPLSD